MTNSPPEKDFGKNLHLSLEIRNISHRIQRYMQSSPTKRDLDNITGLHGYILGYLSRNQERDIFQRDIEERFEIRRSTVTTVLQLMEKNGLITRTSVPQDARLKKIVLTEKAKDIQCKMFAELNALEIKLTEGISKRELDSFYGVIDKLRNNIEKYEHGGIIFDSHDQAAYKERA